MITSLMLDTDLEFDGASLLEENQYPELQLVFISHSKFQKLNQK